MEAGLRNDWKTLKTYDVQVAVNTMTRCYIADGYPNNYLSPVYLAFLKIRFFACTAPFIGRQ